MNRPITLLSAAVFALASATAMAQGAGKGGEGGERLHGVEAVRGEAERRPGEAAELGEKIGAGHAEDFRVLDLS